jgi:hypothetical protein
MFQIISKLKKYLTLKSTKPGFRIIQVSVFVSYKTYFLVSFKNEEGLFKTNEVWSDNFQLELRFPIQSIQFTFKVFITNPNLIQDQSAQLIIFENQKPVKDQIFKLSNIDTYNGWFTINENLIE